MLARATLGIAVMETVNTEGAGAAIVTLAVAVSLGQYDDEDTHVTVCAPADGQVIAVVFDVALPIAAPPVAVQAYVMSGAVAEG